MLIVVAPADDAEARTAAATVGATTEAQVAVGEIRQDAEVPTVAAVVPADDVLNGAKAVVEVAIAVAPDVESPVSAAEMVELTVADVVPAEDAVARACAAIDADTDVPPAEKMAVPGTVATTDAETDVLPAAVAETEVDATEDAVT